VSVEQARDRLLHPSSAVRRQLDLEGSAAAVIEPATIGEVLPWHHVLSEFGLRDPSPWASERSDSEPNLRHGNCVAEDRQPGSTPPVDAEHGSRLSCRRDDCRLRMPHAPSGGETELLPAGDDLSYSPVADLLTAADLE
jgi:hypothetical protein